MHIFRRRAKNRIDLPAGAVAAAGLEQGDILHPSPEQDRVILTARELLDHGRSYKMADLLGAASGLYESAGDVDAEIAAGRAD